MPKTIEICFPEVIRKPQALAAIAKLNTSFSNTHKEVFSYAVGNGQPAIVFSEDAAKTFREAQAIWQILNMLGLHFADMTIIFGDWIFENGNITDTDRNTYWS